MRITYECWDNFAIIKAYRSESTYNLNERQLVLYDKYTKILEEIISPNQSDIEKEIAIHDSLVDNINYVDTGDSSYNAYSALINGIAVCIGYTECFKTLLDMLGIENRQFQERLADSSTYGMLSTLIITGITLM